MRNAYKILVGKPEGKREVGRPRLRWNNNIKIGLKEIRYDNVHLTQLAYGRLKVMRGY
jgi:hypothetical protein